MTLKEVVAAVRETFIGADDQVICRLLDELEADLKGEIFSPQNPKSGTGERAEAKDLNATLLLGKEYLSLYTNYVFSKLAYLEGDVEESNGYSQLFNERYGELLAKMRRKNRPKRKNRIYGRGIK